NMILTDDTGKIKFTFKGITNINSLSNATVSVNGNSIKLTQIASPKSTGTTTIQGQNISNATTYRTIYGNNGNVTIKNSAGGVKIYAGNGNDSIYSSVLYTINDRLGYVTIDGGSGDDKIQSNDPYVSINGGSGNDSIKTNGWSNVTVKGGSGNDTIDLGRGSNNVIQYSAGDGDDVIYGYVTGTKLQLSGSVTGSLKSGSDVKYYIGSGSNRGSLTFKNVSTSVRLYNSRNYVENEDERWFMADDEAYASKGFVQNDELSEIMPVNDFSSNAELYTANSTTSTINSQLTSVTYDKNNN
ncbi:MAG: hypothetical protein IJ797_02195, partial [Selenomonadaceae bacterium]|nr:hypothetical protein [Selenomonadaceae bacterium]